VRREALGAKGKALKRKLPRFENSRNVEMHEAQRAGDHPNLRSQSVISNFATPQKSIETQNPPENALDTPKVFSNSALIRR
jgi:hypothetical protein